jgi:hypothetical protein
LWGDGEIYLQKKPIYQDMFVRTRNEDEENQEENEETENMRHEVCESMHFDSPSPAVPSVMEMGGTTENNKRGNFRNT